MQEMTSHLFIQMQNVQLSATDILPSFVQYFALTSLSLAFSPIFPPLLPTPKPPFLPHLFKSPILFMAISPSHPHNLPWPPFACHQKIYFPLLTFSPAGLLTSGPLHLFTFSRAHFNNFLASSLHHLLATSPHRHIATSPHRHIATSPHRHIATSPPRTCSL